MSIFFGIFRPQGGPVDPEAFEEMRKASEREGYDGMRTHIEDKIAVGHLMLRVSPEDDFDEQPLKSSCGRYLLVGHFRLDYRDELGDKIGLTQSELEKTPDSRLVMMAYQKWGNQCVHHIDGDFAFILYDISSTCLYFFRDRSGCSALFYRIYNNALYFSTNPGILIFEPYFMPSINIQHLIRLSSTGFWKKGFETLHKEVLTVNNASVYFFDGSLMLMTSKYWKPVNYKSTLYINDIDYAFDLFSLLQLSICSRVKRLQSQVGLFLSSGLDSTAVAYIGSKILLHQNMVLNTYTSFPLHTRNYNEKNLQLINEMPDVEKFVKTIPNIRANFFDFSESKISELILSSRTSDIFNPVITPNTFWIDGIFSNASKMGVSLMMNAQLGNFTISCANNKYYLRLFFALRFKALFHELLRYSRYSGIKFSIAFYRKVIREFFTSFNNYRFNLSSTIAQRVKKDLFFDFDKKGIQKFIDETIDTFSISHFFHSKKIRLHLLESALAYVGINWYRESHRVMMMASDPTADSRLINYSFEIPESIYTKFGTKNYLYKLMMKGKVSDHILDAPYKKHQSADIHFRILDDQKLIQIKNDLSSVDIGPLCMKYKMIDEFYLNIRSQKKVLERVYASQRFLNLISLASFLKKQIRRTDDFNSKSAD